MSLRIQRRVKTSKNSHINISNSGVSMSARIGKPRKLGTVTINSRGKNSIYIAKGISFKF